MKTKQLLTILTVILFTSISVLASIPAKKGLWKFDDANNMLKATIGLPLDTTGNQHFSAMGPYDGNLAIADPRWRQLIMTHGLGANGGGTRLNEYTLLWDVMVTDLLTWRCLIQTGLINEGDGDLFIRPTTGVLGTTAFKWSTRAIVPDQWFRVVLSVKAGFHARIYVDGELWVEGNIPLVDSRFSLLDKPRIFGDDNGEDNLIYCAELAIWDVALTESEVAKLGNATTPSIPFKKGEWTFDDASDLNAATIGAPLTLTGTQTPVPGPTTTDLATAVPLGSFLSMEHGIAPNLGGILVNEWTLQVDFLLPELSKWYSFFQTATGDADLFVARTTSGARAANSIGTATTGYSINTLSVNKWYRMLVSVKNGEFFRIYVDGVLWLDAPGQPIDGRWGLGSVLKIFQDDDGDDALINCSYLAIWDVALTTEQAVELDTVPVVISGLKSTRIDASNLSQNFPNPFSNTTIFPYQIEKNENVRFRVLDVSGKEVNVINEGTKMPGQYNLLVNSSNLNNGIYYLQMITSSGVSTRKMIVLK
ncbi:MAG: T9SS type A sorting domain-containing protein [Paludibacter sp.]|nr:T9SS type A sorting domain-containing protein [Paludibacter sp.]